MWLGELDVYLLRKWYLRLWLCDVGVGRATDGSVFRLLGAFSLNWRQKGASNEW